MAGADVPLHTQYMAMAGAGGVRERVCLYCTAFGTRVYLLAVALTPGVFSSVSVKSCPAKSVSGNTLHVAAASGRSSSTAHVRIAKRFEVGGGSRRGRQSCRDDFEQLWTHFLFTLHSQTSRHRDAFAVRLFGLLFQRHNHGPFPSDTP